MQTYYGPANQARADAARRDHEISKIVILSVDQIAELPWQGNHASDATLFFKVDKFIRSLTDRESQKQALYLMEKHAIGNDRPVTDEELDEYLNSGE